MANGVNGPQMPQGSAPKPPVPEAKVAAPAAAVKAVPKPVPTAGGADKNVFTELFGESAPEGSNIMGAVTEKSEKGAKSFFGKKPALDEVKGKTTAKGKKVRRAKPGAILLQVSILAVIVMGAFFYTQNTESFSLFGVNPAQRSQIAMMQVSDLQADIDVQNNLAAVLLLDQFATEADEYFFNLDQSVSSYNSQNKRTEFIKTAANLKPKLSVLLEDIQTHIRPTVQDIPMAREVIDNLILELQTKSGEVDEQSLLQDIQDLESAKVLLQSKDYRTLILIADPSDLKDEEIEGIFLGYSQINRSVSAIINSIQSARTDWTLYFTELESITKEVDPLFNTEFTGSLNINSVSFNEGGISINGESATDDTKNFTLTSNLIDAYEDSELFENVEDRTYSKREGDAEFTSDFSINLDIILNPEDNE